MKIGIGSDHGGYNLKREIADFLKKRGYEVIDFGTHGNESVDYPDFGLKVAEAVKAASVTGYCNMRYRTWHINSCKQGSGIRAAYAPTVTWQE